MAVDHIGIVFFPQYIIFRIIGRLSFPIFCFLLVEGFCHTSNLIKYMIRLFLFAVVSEVPFDLLFYGKPLDFSHQNVFFTLFLGVLMLYIYEMQAGGLAKLGSIVMTIILAEVLHTDYSYVGLLIILMFYLFYERVWPRNISVAAINIAAMGGIQCFGALAVFPISLYKGEQGRRVKYFFYAFYPAHLLLLFMARIFM